MLRHNNIVNVINMHSFAKNEIHGFLKKIKRSNSK
jgi:hypothetical protein